MTDFMNDACPQRFLRHPDGTGLFNPEAVEDPVEERLREVDVIESFVYLLAPLDHSGTQHEADFGDQRLDRRAGEAFRLLREDLVVEHVFGADAVVFR